MRTQLWRDPKMVIKICLEMWRRRNVNISTASLMWMRERARAHISINRGRKAIFSCEFMNYYYYCCRHLWHLITYSLCNGLIYEYLIFVLSHVNVKHKINQNDLYNGELRNQLQFIRIARESWFDGRMSKPHKYTEISIKSRKLTDIALNSRKHFKISD